MKGNLFSESWYKVADIRVGLPHNVEVQKQYYRGALWYVLQDGFNNTFFRVSPEAYHFIALLTPDKTIEQVWEACLERHEEKAPSQEEVIGLLAQLHANNLLFFKNAPQNEFVFERAREKREKELKSRFLSIISIKIPLWNPDRWLQGMMPLIRMAFGWPGLGLWAVVVFLGSAAFVDHFAEAYDRTQSILSQSNLVFFYLALALLKLFHECGHAMVNKRFGGQVPTLGVMFLVFTPLPYMDATSSWFFQNRWHRIGVSAAGMMVDLFCAALAALVWAGTGDGLIHSVAFNMMVIGSVTSLAFNGNPLIRFDAYYIFSDWLEIPNLYQRARRQWAYWMEKYLFDVASPAPAAQGRREAAWLGLYGAASLVYRVFLTVAIVLFVADQVLFVGLLLAAVSLGVGIIWPLKRFISYLAGSQKLFRTRKRAVAISITAAAALLLFAGWCPLPYAIRAPGVVESKEYAKVYAATEGGGRESLRRKRPSRAQGRTHRPLGEPGTGAGHPGGPGGTGPDPGAQAEGCPHGHGRSQTPGGAGKGAQRAVGRSGAASAGTGRDGARDGRVRGAGPGDLRRALAQASEPDRCVDRRRRLPFLRHRLPGAGLRSLSGKRVL